MDVTVESLSLSVFFARRGLHRKRLGDVMQWALAMQGTRRNVADEDIKRCESEALKRIGRRLNAEKKPKGEHLKSKNRNKPQAEVYSEPAASRIAKEEGVGRATVERAAARMEIHDTVEESTPRPAPSCYNLTPAANDRLLAAHGSNRGVSLFPASNVAKRPYPVTLALSY